jgi:hypothetical protein
MEAAVFSQLDYRDALQFTTCRVIGARFLVTRRDYGVKKSSVARRTAAEVWPLFQRER